MIAAILTLAAVGCLAAALWPDIRRHLSSTCKHKIPWDSYCVECHR